MTPYCAAWFLQRHASFLGADIVARRVKSFPVLREVADLVEIARQRAG